MKFRYSIDIVNCVWCLHTFDGDGTCRVEIMTNNGNDMRKYLDYVAKQWEGYYYA